MSDILAILEAFPPCPDCGQMVTTRIDHPEFDSPTVRNIPKGTALLQTWPGTEEEHTSWYWECGCSYAREAVDGQPVPTIADSMPFLADVIRAAAAEIDRLRAELERMSVERWREIARESWVTS